MKKIVALVLAMVMVLGLATTAFAATAGATGDVDALVAGATAAQKAWRYELDEKDEADAEDQTFATYEVVAYALYKGAQTWWDGAVDTADEAGEDFDVVVGGVSEFVKVVNAAEATLTIVDGKEITYLAPAASYTAWALEAKEVYVPYCVPAKWACDSLYALSPAGQFVYEDAKENLYVADPTSRMIINVGGAALKVSDAGIYDATVTVNGTAVDTLATATDVLVYTGHEFEADSEGNTYTEASLKKVYCDGCDKSFKFVVGPQTLAIKTFGEDYVFAGLWGDDAAINAGQAAPIWVGTASTTAGAPAVDADKDATVESPKTFDAGIAMYVGMSVMAAAGSAVVLKKKD